MTMKPLRISDRTWILTFDDDISVLVIIGKRYTVLCDTHLGPESMREVIEFLASVPHPENLFIFNSHSDWDHIWGNCAFPDAIIASHTTCRKRMMERGAFDLSRECAKTKGCVQIQLPNLTFDTMLVLEDDDIEFWYAPGHTIDSSVCFDRKGRNLYLGDLVEDPIPYIDYDRLDIYINTLELIISLPAENLISAHSGIVTRDLIRSNIAYLSMVLDGIPIDSSSCGAYAQVHQRNMNTLIMFRYEALVRDVQKDRYSFDAFWGLIPDPEVRDTESVETSMKNYLHEIQTRTEKNF